MTCLTDFIRDFQLNVPVAGVSFSQQDKSAAVLLPIVCKQQPTLLLTRRATTLRSHAGQVAFPGGAADATDASLIDTALREAFEEVAIPPNQVQVLGQLSPMSSLGGYQVTPIVGLIPSGIDYHANDAEVDDIFEVPLFDVLSLHQHKYIDIIRFGTRRRVFFYWYKNRMIWGLTAAILHQLALQLN